MNQEFIIPYDNYHIDSNPFCCMVCQFLYWKKNPVKFMVSSSDKYPTLDKVITQRTVSEYNFMIFNDNNNWTNNNYPVAITLNDINKLRCNEKMINIIYNKIGLNKQIIENNIKLINVNRLLINYGCVNVVYDEFKSSIEELNENYGLLFFRIMEELVGCDEMNIKAAGPREILEKFGGIMTINKFRDSMTVSSKVIKMSIPPMIPLISDYEEIVIDK